MYFTVKYNFSKKHFKMTEDDEIYKTEQAKYDAIIKSIKESYEKMIYNSFNNNYKYFDL